MLAGLPVRAQGQPEVLPAISFGLSYPLVLSAGGGILLPLGKSDKSHLPPGFRGDFEVGLGGGSLSVGVFAPVSDWGLVSLKATRMRTWLLTWNEERDRTFDGGVLEFAIPGGHGGGPKLGLGRFKDTEPLNGRRDTFTYVFIGLGW